MSEKGWVENDDDDGRFQGMASFRIGPIPCFSILCNCVVAAVVVAVVLRTGTLLGLRMRIRLHASSTAGRLGKWYWVAAVSSSNAPRHSVLVRLCPMLQSRPYDDMRVLAKFLPLGAFPCCC